MPNIFVHSRIIISLVNKVKDGAKAIVVSSSKILLFHRDNNPGIRYPDHWHIIGGAIEDGETPEQAVLRELNEEATYVPNKYLFLKQDIGSQGEKVYMFLFPIDDSEEKLFKHGQVVKEGQGIGFFTIKEALKLKLTPRTRELLDKLATGGTNTLAKGLADRIVDMSTS